ERGNFAKSSGKENRIPAQLHRIAPGWRTVFETHPGDDILFEVGRQFLFISKISRRYLQHRLVGVVGLKRHTPLCAIPNGIRPKRSKDLIAPADENQVCRWVI